MINPIGSYATNTPNYYLGFRSVNQNNGGTNFQKRAVPVGPQRVDWLNIDRILTPQKRLPDITDLPGVKIKEFSPGTKESARDKRIEKEKNHITKPITERTEYNTRQLRAAGVPERDVKRYLKIDGHVTEEGKRILREKGKGYK